VTTLRPPPSWRAALGALLAGAAIAGSTIAGAFPALAGAQTGGVGVLPGHLEAEVGRGEALPPFTISNNSANPVEIEAQPLPAKQDISGLPVYDFSKTSRQAGEAMLRVTPRRFVLPPGGKRTVNALLTTCPQTGLGTYGVIAFTAQQQLPASKSEGQVTPSLRLASTLLLRSPPRPCIDGELTRLRAEQRGKGQLVFFAGVRNIGNLHAKPRVMLTILKGGRVVDRHRFPLENVIPRAERELELPFAGRLAEGDYEAVAKATMGFGRSTRRWKFHLSGTNLLPTPKLTLRTIGVEDAQPGREPGVNVDVKNVGTAAAPSILRVSLFRLGSGEPLETKLVRLDKLDPGRARQVTAHFSALERGEYQAQARLSSEGREVGAKDFNFVVKQGPSLFSRVTDWMAGHVLVVLLLLLGVFAAASAAMFAYFQRKAARFRTQASGPTPAEPETAAIRDATPSLPAAKRGRRGRRGSRAGASPKVRTEAAERPGAIPKSAPRGEPAADAGATGQRAPRVKARRRAGAGLPHEVVEGTRRRPGGRATKPTNIDGARGNGSTAPAKATKRSRTASKASRDSSAAPTPVTRSSTADKAGQLAGVDRRKHARGTGTNGAHAVSASPETPAQPKTKARHNGGATKGVVPVSGGKSHRPSRSSGTGQEERLTFHDWVQRWIATQEADGEGLADSTRKSYARDLERYPLHYFSDRKQLSGIRPRDIEGFVEWLHDPKKQGKQLSESTVRRALTPLRACLESAAGEGLISRNPALGTESHPPGQPVASRRK